MADRSSNLDSDDGRPRSWVVAIVLAVLLAPLLWMGYATLGESQDAADHSCLASIHSELVSLHVLDGASSPEWREWDAAETARVLARSRAGDCTSQKRWLPRDLGIATRRAGDDRTESRLWRKSRPLVSSGPWISP